MKREWVGPLFVVAGIYDFVLGLVYLLAYKPIYERLGIALPNHPGYVQLNAIFIVIFGLGFLLVARSPERNRDIIKLGVLLKLAYSGLVLTYYFLGNMPAMWVLWAVADLLFLLAFLAALRVLPAAAGQGREIRA
jgi:hypothetical protein